MFKESFIRAINASVIFILLQWIGDKYFLDHDSPIYMYLIQGVIFTAIMTVTYYFILKRQNRKDKYK